MASEVIQVDPDDCGCTECITGLYVPLNMATYGEIYLASVGVLGNATGLTGVELRDKLHAMTP